MRALAASGARRAVIVLAAAAVVLAFSAAAASAQAGEQEPGEPPAPAALFPHPDDVRWWLSGQANIIAQAHPSFPALYTGANSFRPDADRSVSRVFTLYTGVRLLEHTAVLVDLEMAAGRGLSDATGLGGYTNLDIVRNPSLGSAPYLARAMIHHVVALSKVTAAAERGTLNLFRTLPVRRIEIRVGKMSLVDFFDVNSVGSDSHLQFMNWAIDNDGAYDYAADTRGYTWAAVVEYQDRGWGLRVAEALMPDVANGIVLDGDLTRARGENVELEWRHGLLPGRPGPVSLLGYENHANMGSYAEAVDRALATGQTPDIVATRREGRVKYGFGLNVEQEAPGGIRVFARAGWNDGQTESFVYTEIDRTVSAGFDWRGGAWSRPADKIGVAVAVNGLSASHSSYLALGGLGFLLGDGALNYGTERIVEGYYTASVWRGIRASADVQHITNPGYNRDRGAVFVASARLHVDF